MIKFNKYLILVLIFLVPNMGLSALSELDRSIVERGKNLLKNPGFEGGISQWLSSGGSFTKNTTTSNVAYGNASAAFDASASSQTVTSTAVAIPAGLYGSNAVASCKFKTTAIDYKIQSYDGTNVLSETLIPSSSTFVQVTTNFAMPTSGNIQMRVISQSNAAVIYFDDCYLGQADGFNLNNISQASLIGSANIPGNTNCNWSRTNTALGAFTSDSDCLGPTIVVNSGPGTISTTDTDLPKFTVSNLPSGDYEVIMTVSGVNAGIAGSQLALAISDGTDTRGKQQIRVADATVDEVAGVTIVAHFTYSSNADRTFELFGAASAGSIDVSNDQTNSSLNFSIKRFPSSSEQAYRPDVVAQAWSGYHTVTSGWATTSSTFVDPSSGTGVVLTETTNLNAGTVTTAASSLPGIIFNVTRTGIFEVCTTISAQASVASTPSARLVDGSGTPLIQGHPLTYTASNDNGFHTFCGQYNASVLGPVTFKIQTATNTGTFTINNGVASGSAAISWTVKSLSQNLPAPLLVNSVASSSSGIERIERAIINCGSATIDSQSGSWISSNSTNGTGDCTLNITAGTFSGTPTCTCSTGDTTKDRICTTYSASSSAIRFTIVNPSLTSVSAPLNVICMGPR